jgi:acyl-CoA:acyl-CoA alkyltransferase
MKLLSVKAAFPSRTVSNDEVVELIREYSAKSFVGDLDEALQRVSFYLAYSGSESRRWLLNDERPIDLLHEASERAMREAGLARHEIDLLIYTGIGRGFIEPGGAYHAAAMLGLERATCFDILDACMSWTRAIQIASSFMRTAEYRTVMIVNAEFNMMPGGSVFPAVFKLPSLSAVDWSLPAYTIGEAATATILVADSSPPWPFAFSSRSDLVDLCNVPLHGYEGYSRPSERLAKNGVGRFTSYGFQLHEEASREAPKLFDDLDIPKDEVRLLVTHASSKRFWNDMAAAVGMSDRVYHIYPRTGNVVSASVPAAIAVAAEEGRLNRGDRVAAWVGSAGMSFGAFSFVY